MLDSTCFRIGLIGALRSLSLGGQVVGLMVTASHNPEPDNGVKMVDAHGEMLAAAWEPVCTRIANAATDEALVLELQHVVDEFQIDLRGTPRVVYAYDSRPSSPDLVRAITDGLRALGADAIDGGLLTTPQLHYLVVALNTKNMDHPYGEPTEAGYYQKLADAYVKVVGADHKPVPLVVDCANGVGTKALRGFLDVLPQDMLDITPLRTAMLQDGQLNFECGADFVKTTQGLPRGYDTESCVREGQLMCSFDGDADRIVFYYLTGPANDKASFHLLDGDKIASLVADYLSSLVAEAQLDVRLGCVQTAYANGASTAYLAKKVPITCTKTGVKHLHHAAEEYDIGVYFEANGHGTVLFAPRTMVAMALASRTAQGPALVALQKLQALSVLINQAVGDALSDMLMVLAVLAARQWDAQQWDACYTDLPNRLIKVTVPDRTVFTTTDAERKLVTPVGVQAQIEALAGQVAQGRAFVRPSGTEDCVRVYAEAATAEDAERLVKDVSQLVVSSV